MTLDAEAIETIAKTKADDYIEDLFVQLLLESSDDAVGRVREMAHVAKAECTFNGDDVDADLLALLQEKIDHNVQITLKSIAQKAQTKSV